MGRTQFAFGDETVAGAPCPAMESSVDHRGKVLEVAETYDEVARESVEASSGVISATDAEKYWDEALDRVRRRRDDERGMDEEHVEYLEDAIEKGKEVAAEVF